MRTAAESFAAGVAGYVLKLEGVNFICWTNMEWRRQYEAELAKPAS